MKYESETAQLYYNLQTRLKDRIKEKNSSITHPKPSDRTACCFPIKGTPFVVAARASGQKRCIAVELRIKGTDPAIVYARLKEHQEHIENALGKLDWDSAKRENEIHIRLERNDLDPNKEANWTEICDWYIDRVNLFTDVFRKFA